MIFVSADLAEGSRLVRPDQRAARMCAGRPSLTFLPNLLNGPPACRLLVLSPQSKRFQEDLYDLMRVRGFGGGYYVDAIAGVDIALWDLNFAVK